MNSAKHFTEEPKLSAAPSINSPSAELSDLLPPTAHDYTLAQVAEGILREYFDETRNISLQRSDGLEIPEKWQGLIDASSLRGESFCCETEDGERCLIGIGKESSDLIRIHYVGSSGFSSRFITSSEAERIASSLAFYRLPIRELVGLYTSKIDPLLQKYALYLDDFESTLDLSRNPTPLQLEYERYCKLQWIIYKDDDESEEVAPADIQEMQDIQRILCVRRKEAWSSISRVERRALDSAYLQIMDELNKFYLAQVDHHPLIVTGVRYFASIADRALVWLASSTPFDDTALNKRLELADAPGFFERFASIFLTKASVSIR